jgi:hypothetical protein
MFPAINTKDADTDLGVFENRSEEALTGLKRLTRALALRDVFG